MLNHNYVAILAEGKIQLHTLEEISKNQESKTKMFPEKEKESIACFALTIEFLIYATTDGSLFYFYLNDWAFVNE
jgi:hypothetical protein